MTNKEAIEILRANYPDACFGQLREAVDAAIEALKAQNVAGDTISRQAAIDAIENAFDRETILNRFVRKIAISAVRLLPSAQPEIIRCKDCKYARLTNDGSCKYCDIWFPDEAEYMDGDYYCASAERKSNG